MALLEQLFPFIILIAIMYFIIIRPQQKQAKAHREMLASLKKGDKVVTSGGLIVEIQKVEAEFLTILLNKEVSAKLTKDAVSRKYEDEA
jgi:preprotein translocase subunit YajC